MGTGAVSRYKLSRSQKFVKVQNFNCVQMRVSGCNDHYKFVLGAGAKAKTVTNNLPILSVLGNSCYLTVQVIYCQLILMLNAQIFCQMVIESFELIFASTVFLIIMTRTSIIETLEDQTTEL